MKPGRAFFAILCGTALAASATAGDFKLGVQTHFSQGWPERLLDSVKASRAVGLRDSVPWSAGERRSGVYDFSSLDFDAIRAACDDGYDFVLTLVPENELYDGGGFVYTAEGRTAFAAYLNAVLDEFGTCIAAIEIGNEINTANAFKGPASKSKFAAYVDLVRAVHGAVKPRHPGTALLGGSTNVVGTGFLKKLFDLDMLSFVDGIVVHPYRRTPEGLDVELGRLNAAMRAAGKSKPIWATEFSDAFERPEDAAPFLIKMVAILGAAGVERAYWYALIDQKWYPVMGLYDAEENPKPAAAAFIAVQDLLLPSGRAVRIDTADPQVRLFRFGNGRYVLWGAPRSLSLTRGSAWDSTGTPVSAPSAIGDAPLILSEDAVWTLGSSVVLADTLYQYGTPPFAYLADLHGTDVPLKLIDWEWTSYWGARGTSPFRINIDSLAVAGDKDNAVRAVIRYTPTGESGYRIQACATKADKGDGMDVTIGVRGKVVRAAHLTTALSAVETIPAGAPADVSFGPHKVSGGDAARYRIRILAPDGEAPPCP